VLAVLLISPFLGLDNFAVSVALALQGIRRARCAIVIGLFRGMAALATALGGGVGGAWSQSLGTLAQYAGGLILIALGAYELWQEHHASAPQRPFSDSLASLALVAIAVRLDSVVAGIAFGLRHDPILPTALVVGTTTAVLSFAGLVFGTYVSKWRALPGQVAPVVLVSVGLAIATGVL
jgi:putative Mn2+ efflux pump MntP